MPAIKVLPAPTMHRRRRVEQVRSKRKADLTARDMEPSLTVSVATGFVDFDVIDSIHESTKTMSSATSR